MTSEEGSGLMLERLATLHAQAQENRERIAQLTTSLDRLANDLQSARRPQWQLYLTAVGVMLSMITGAVAVLGFVGMAMIRPIEQKTEGIAFNRERIEVLDARAEENAAGIARDRGRMEDHERLLKLLWRKAYGEELPTR